MNIKTRAALYTVGFFVGIFAFTMVLTVLAPYFQPWMAWVAVFGFMFYLMYSMLLTKLKWDESIDKVTESVSRLSTEKK
jgi:hypothetical protein